MTESRRIHPTNAGRSSEALLWGFEGNQLVFVAGGFGVSLAMFRLLYGSAEWNGILALFVALLPFGGTVIWLLLFKRGKPKSYAGEWLEWVILKLRLKAQLPGTFLTPQHHDTRR